MRLQLWYGSLQALQVVGTFLRLVEETRKSQNAGHKGKEIVILVDQTLSYVS